MRMCGVMDVCLCGFAVRQAGKTTLVKLMMGELDPVCGAVRRSPGARSPTKSQIFILKSVLRALLGDPQA